MTDQAPVNTLLNLLVSAAEFVSSGPKTMRTCNKFANDHLRVNLNFVRFWNDKRKR